MTNKFKNVSDARFAKALAFYLQILNLGNRVSIEILPKNLRRGPVESRAWGWCTQLDQLNYEVEIDRGLASRNVLTVLAHELVHVKQYFTGRLQEHEDSVYWLGDICELEYDEQPWEIEAAAMESVMYQAFLEWETK